MIKIISAVSQNGIIGSQNKIPWHYPEDFRHFKKLTNNSIVIMGRKTFESIGKPLPNRDNIVISSAMLEIPGTRRYGSLPAALQAESTNLRTNDKDIWIIGGASIYQEGMQYADEIHLTLVPDYIKGADVVRFPFINPTIFTVHSYSKIDKLDYVIYKRLSKLF